MSAMPASRKPAPPGAGGPGGSLRLITTMGAIGLVCGALIVLTFQATFPVIERNRAAALERAVFDVVPGAERKVTFLVEGDDLEHAEAGAAGGTAIYACYDGEGRLAGVAVEASGQGFQESIRLIYGYSPENKKIIGMKVLESKETPGLGDKIGKDLRFLANFDSLSVRLDGVAETAPGTIQLVKPGQKTESWQIEAITGATISSRAVADILDSSVSRVAPVIARNMSVLKGGGQQ